MSELANAHQPRRVQRRTRTAQVIALSDADRRTLDAAMRQAQQYDAQGRDPAKAIGAHVPNISPEGARALALAHTDDVIRTALDVLTGAERTLAFATLALSASTRERARALAKQVQEALKTQSAA